MCKGQVQGAAIILGGTQDADSDSEDADNLLVGSAFDGMTFNKWHPQLLRNMERVATDLAAQAVQEQAKLFATIVICGGIISVAGSSAQLSMVTMDFVAGASRFCYKEEPLSINEFFQHVLSLLQPQ